MFPSFPFPFSPFLFLLHRHVKKAAHGFYFIAVELLIIKSIKSSLKAH